MASFEPSRKVFRGYAVREEAMGIQKGPSFPHWPTTSLTRGRQNGGRWPKGHIPRKGIERAGTQCGRSERKCISRSGTDQKSMVFIPSILSAMVRPIMARGVRMAMGLSFCPEAGQCMEGETKEDMAVAGRTGSQALASIVSNWRVWLSPMEDWPGAGGNHFWNLSHM
jgi:hypothetical protein